MFMKKITSLALVLGFAFASSASALTLGELGGQWYNPDQSGQGFEFEAAQEGFSLKFYTFENANVTQSAQGQAWFVTELKPVSTDATNVYFGLHRIAEGGLGTSAYNAPATVSGAVTITAQTCEAVTAHVYVADESLGCDTTVDFGPYGPTHCEYDVNLVRLTHTTACGQ